MNKNLINNSILIIMFALTSLTSCGKKKNHRSSENAVVKSYFVKGDTLEIIKDTVNNPNSFITKDNFINFDGYILSNIVQFTPVEEIVKEKDPNSSIEEGHESNEIDLTKVNRENYRFNFSKTNDSLIFKDNENSYILKFKLVGSIYQLTHLQVDKNIYPVNEIHYSLKQDQNAFSILFYVKTDDNLITLLNFSFYKELEKFINVDISDVNKKFKYLLGPGVKNFWSPIEKKLEFNICKNKSEEINPVSILEQYKNGLKGFNSILKDRLDIFTKVYISYPPFSDLNFHCIYTINNYLVNENNFEMVAGSTYSTFNYSNREFLDSDIFIWVKEYDKNQISFANQSKITKIIIHELGHALGLDHQFTDSIPSIMSYNSEINEAQDYDKEALEILYPIKR